MRHRLWVGCSWLEWVGARAAAGRQLPHEAHAHGAQLSCSSLPSRPATLTLPPPALHRPQGWIGFVETCAPEILPHLSTCKSPHMMVGSVLKTYFADVRRLAY